MKFEILLRKQPIKYLKSVDANTRKKLCKALDDLSYLRGNIVRLQGAENTYRMKIDHYRIIFTKVKNEIVITVIEINTRTNIKY